jgi:hypothetical protein
MSNIAATKTPNAEISVLMRWATRPSLPTATAVPRPGRQTPVRQGNGAASGQGTGQHDEVADLLWDDVKCFFDPDLTGSLPDVRVPGASVEDWQAILDLVAERG